MHSTDPSRQDVDQVRVHHITFRKYPKVQYSYRTHPKSKIHYSRANHIHISTINNSLTTYLAVAIITIHTHNIFINNFILFYHYSISSRYDVKPLRWRQNHPLKQWYPTSIRGIKPREQHKLCCTLAFPSIQ
jgi:hypothetical protein